MYFLQILLLFLVPFINSQPLPSNILTRAANPTAMHSYDSLNNQISSPFFDLGSWHGFLNPAFPSNYGSFSGPLIIAQEYSVFLASKFDQLKLSSYNLSAPLQSTFEAYPHKLYQFLGFHDLEITLELVFASQFTAISVIELKNIGEEDKIMDVEFDGELMEDWEPGNRVENVFPEWKRSATKLGNVGIEFQIGGIQHSDCIILNEEARYLILRSIETETVINEDGLGYSSKAKEKITLQRKSGVNIVTAHSFFNTKDQKINEIGKIQGYLIDYQRIMNNAEERWRFLNFYKSNRI